MMFGKNMHFYVVLPYPINPERCECIRRDKQAKSDLEFGETES